MQSLLVSEPYYEGKISCVQSYVSYLICGGSFSYFFIWMIIGPKTLELLDLEVHSEFRHRYFITGDS